MAFNHDNAEKNYNCFHLSLSFLTIASENMIEKITAKRRSFFSESEEDPEASMFNSYRHMSSLPVLPESSESHKDDFINKFEILLDRYGVEAVLFLSGGRDCLKRQQSGCGAIVGKACSIRSRFKRPCEVEFGIRYGVRVTCH